MAIERTFEAAFQKAVRSLEMGGRSLLWEDATWREPEGLTRIWSLIDTPNDIRLWALMAALRRGVTVAELHQRTRIDTWFLERLACIHALEQRLLREPLTPRILCANAHCDRVVLHLRIPPTVESYTNVFMEVVAAIPH
jgi:carbamoyl-phosphate synthase large subunit